MTEAEPGATPQDCGRWGRGWEGLQREQSTVTASILDFKCPELRRHVSVDLSPQIPWYLVTAALGSSRHHLWILGNWRSERQPPAEHEEAPLCEAAPRRRARVQVSEPSRVGVQGAEAMTENQTTCLKTEVGGP